MQRYEAVLFDFDGVILDSEPIHFDCWKEVLAPYGVQMDWETDYPQCIGVSDREVVEFLVSRMEKPVPAEQLWKEYERKNKLFVERVAGDPPIPKATRELLATLEKNYKLAIVSSSGRSEVAPLLEAGGIRQYFRVVITGDDVTNYKPHPEPYLLAAKHLNVTRAVVVEDSDAGERSGIAAGFDLVRVHDAERTAELVLAHLRTSSGQP